MIRLWWLWGIAWLYMPRMTIGLILIFVTPHQNLGLGLAIIGGFLDMVNKHG